MGELFTVGSCLRNPGSTNPKILGLHTLAFLLLLCFPDALNPKATKPGPRTTPGSETHVDGQWVVPLESGRIQPLAVPQVQGLVHGQLTQPQESGPPRDPPGAPWTPARKC